MLAASILRRTFLALFFAVGIAASPYTSAFAQTDPLVPARKVLLRQIAITNYINPFRPGQKMTTDPGISGANNGAD
jgi:hypothetical protein